jgi:RNA ligase (TIGR02306 family)
MPEEDGAKPSNRIWEISKTDEDRYQSNTKLVKDLQGCEYYATIKLDGTSMTMITNIDDNDNPEVNVCGRNSCYIEDPNNKYWKIANQYNIKEQMLDYYKTNNIRIAFQGELIGPKIQGNKMGLDENDVYIFNVFEAKGKQPFEKCDYETSKYYTEKFGLKFVPVRLEGIFTYEKEELQSLTNAKYIEYFPNANPEQLIEGLVFRSKDMKISFKVVSNEFLLKGGE